MPRAVVEQENEPEPLILEGQNEGGAGVKASQLKRPIDKKAEEIARKIALPKVPGRNIDARQWEEWASLLTNEMWSQVGDIYVYRLKPRIIRQLSDPNNKNYIDKAQRVVNLTDYIKKMHGGGKYRCEVNGMVTGMEKKLCDIIVDIPINEVEPLLDYRELDKTHSDNIGYMNFLRSKGILDDKGNPSHPSSSSLGQQGVTMQDMISMFDKMITTVTRMTQEQKEEFRERLSAQENQGLGGQIGALLLEKMKQDDPTKMITGFGSMMQAAKEIIGEKKDSGENLLVKMLFDTQTKMMEMSNKHSEQMLATIKEMKEPKTAGNNLLDSVETALSVMERLTDISGRGGPRSGWDIGLDWAKELLIPGLQYATQLYAITKGVPVAGVGGAPVTQQPNQQKRIAPTGERITAGQLAAEEGGRIVPDTPEKAVNGAPTVPAEGAAIVPPELVNTIGMVGGTIVRYLNDGKTGAELADLLVEMWTKKTWIQITAVGEEGIIAAMKQIPQLWNDLMVFGEDRIKQFVHEFCDYENYEQEEIEEVPEPSPKPARRSGRQK